MSKSIELAIPPLAVYLLLVDALPAIGADALLWDQVILHRQRRHHRQQTDFAGMPDWLG